MVYNQTRYFPYISCIG